MSIDLNDIRVMGKNYYFSVKEAAGWRFHLAIHRGNHNNASHCTEEQI